MTLDQIGRCRYVTARRHIDDSPLALDPCHACRGDVGEVCDVDTANGIAFVDFGGGAIAVTANEVRA